MSRRKEQGYQPDIYHSSYKQSRLSSSEQSWAEKLKAAELSGKTAPRASYSRETLVADLQSVAAEIKAIRPDISPLVTKYSRVQLALYDLQENPPDDQHDENNMIPLEAWRIKYTWTVRLLAYCIRIMELSLQIVDTLHARGDTQFDSYFRVNQVRWLKVKDLPSLAVDGRDGQPPMLFEVLNQLSERFTNQAQQLDTDTFLYVGGIFSEMFHYQKDQAFGYLMGSLIRITPDNFEEVYRKFFAVSSENQIVRRFFYLISNFMLQAYQGLMDEDDPRHEGSTQFIADVLTSDHIPADYYLRISHLAEGAIFRRIDGELDDLTLMRNLRALAAETGQAWYQDLAQRIHEVVQTQNSSIIYTAEQLAHYDVDQDPESAYQLTDLRAVVAQLKIDDHWQWVMGRFLAADFVQGQAVGARLSLRGQLLMVELGFLVETLAVEDVEAAFEKDGAVLTEVTRIKFAIQLDSDQPELYFNLVDPELVSPTTKMSLVTTLTQLLLTTQQSDDRFHTAELEASEDKNQPYDPIPAKSKGRRQLPRGEHKRSKPLSKTENSSTTIHSFDQEIIDQGARPLFCLSEETKSALAERFTASELAKIEEKIAMANNGGTIVKVYAHYQGPGTGTVWAIRLSQEKRILAQESDEKGVAYVYAVKTKAELRKEMNG